MHRAYQEFEELTCPVELASHSDVTDKEVQSALKWYYELIDTVHSWLVTEDGVAVLMSLMYVIYHLISKLRGNEKNVSMNTFGIAMAMLALNNLAVTFTVDSTYLFINDKWDKWTYSHSTLANWIWWSG